VDFCSIAVNCWIFAKAENLLKVIMVAKMPISEVFSKLSKKNS